MTGFVVVSGCGETGQTNGPTSRAEPTGKKYLLDSEPANAIPVGAARIEAKDGEAVALIGHIGGSPKPFVDGLAAFTIVDPQVAYCPPEEGCPTPWDYCCTPNDVKRENMAAVKVVDENGEPVAEDARQLLGVSGTLTRCGRGNGKS